MPKGSGMGDQLYVDGIDLGGDINSVQNIHGGNAPLPATDITQLAMARFGGPRDGGFDFTSYFDPAAGKSHASFSALPTVDRIATYGHGVLAAGASANVVAKQINYDGNRGQDGSYLLNVSTQSNAFGLEWATQLTAGKLTQGAAGNVAGVDQGTASPGAFGLQMYVHLFAFTGTSITIKLQESNDGGADPYTDLTGATTAALTAIGAVRVATGLITCKRFIRAVSVGTFSNAVFHVSAVRNGTQTDF